MKLYNEYIENFGVRVIYLFNTINSFCVLASLFALAVTYIFAGYPISYYAMPLALIVSYYLMKIADWHPFYLPVALISLAFILWNNGVPILVCAWLFAGVTFFYLGVLLVINGGPQVIVGRDLSIPFRMLAQCFTTVVPTTLSFPISVFYAYFMAGSIAASNYIPHSGAALWPQLVVLAINLAAVLMVRKKLPDNIPPNQYRPPKPIDTPFKRVVILNIDGGRWDMIPSLKLPTIEHVLANGSYLKNGLQTVYRALTNPAFGSILTGAVPKDHGIADNNLGQTLGVEGLGDIVKTTIYGCMHMKHFAKEGWETKIVSLPQVGIQKSDDLAMEWLLQDLREDHNTRLFVFDYSEADFCGHSYGGQSKQYIEALRKVDARIGQVLEDLKKLDDYQDVAVIICADHGIHNLDHGYRLFRGESYVPCLFYGERIKKNHVIEKDGMIMDICMTTSWLLGVPYPEKAQGQVYDEIIRY